MKILFTLIGVAVLSLLFFAALKAFDEETMQTPSELEGIVSTIQERDGGAVAAQLRDGGFFAAISWTNASSSDSKASRSESTQFLEGEGKRILLSRGADGSITAGIAFGENPLSAEQIKKRLAESRECLNAAYEALAEKRDAETDTSNQAVSNGGD